MRNLLIVLSLFGMISLTGCGGGDIPEVDEQESEEHREEISQGMEEAMRNGMGGAMQGN